MYFYFTTMVGICTHAVENKKYVSGIWCHADGRARNDSYVIIEHLIWVQSLGYRTSGRESWILTQYLEINANAVIIFRKYIYM